MVDCNNVQDQLVTLNVGGVLHTTSHYTLSNFPNSMLGSMFSGRHSVSAMKDKDGNPFIDRNGIMFTYILDFMRSRQLCLPDGFDNLELLRQEADFYQICDLVDVLDKKLQLKEEELKLKREKEEQEEQEKKKLKERKEREDQLRELREKGFEYHIEMMDIEEIDVDKLRHPPSSYPALEDADMYDPDQLHAMEDDPTMNFTRGLILKGSGSALDSLKPTHGIALQIRRQLSGDPADEDYVPGLIPDFAVVNLVRSVETKTRLIEHFHQQKWQLINTAISEYKDKGVTVYRYIWCKPFSEPRQRPINA